MEEDSPAAGNKRPITEIFSSIEMDLRTGLKPEQIIDKLVDSGLAEENASDAVQAVLRQRKQKQQTRLVAAATIIVVAAILFFFAR